MVSGKHSGKIKGIGSPIKSVKLSTDLRMYLLVITPHKAGQFTATSW